MAKNIVFPEERKALQEAHRRGENLRRQYSMRLGTTHALAFISDCERRNVQPSRRLEELVIEHVEAESQGIKLALDAETRRAFDVIGASLGGIDRNNVAKYLLSRVLKRELTEAQARLEAMGEPLFAHAEPEAKVKSKK